VELYADLTRTLPVIDPENRQLVLGCGAALFHLETAMRYFGYGGHLELFPSDDNPTFLARLRLGFKAETSSEDILLFNAIPKRHTNRQPFRPDPVPEELLASLAAGAQAQGAWLHVVAGDDARNAVADIVAEADRVQWADKAFRAELSHWVHPNRSESRDGLPGYALGISDWSSYAGPLVIRTFDRGRGQAAKDREIALYSPVLAVLGTDDDSPREWLAAGKALAMVLLRARVEDVWASFLNQPVEIPALRQRLGEVVGRGGFPQILLRLGYGPEVKPTPRRSVREVLMHPQGPAMHTIAGMTP
jgi:hypothetical protein